MAERNYPCDNIIIVYFGGNETTLNAVRRSSWVCVRTCVCTIRARLFAVWRD